MMNNKKSQTIFVGIALAVTVLVTVIAMIPALKESITIARNPSNLDCGNSSITTGTSATCIIVDFWMFYFVMSSLGAGLAYVTGMSLYNRVRSQ